jgi:DNA-binding IclR family transcriptional regulator
MTPTTPMAQATAPSILWKAFEVLDSFSQGQRVMTLSEIARRSGLPKSTTHRLLLMLIEVQAVERVGHGYKIGLRMFTRGALCADVSLRDVALPHLERLRRVTRQTVHLAVLQDNDVVYLEKLPSLVSPRTPALVGGRLKAHLTGVGKALLAFSGNPVPAGIPLTSPVPLESRAPQQLVHYLDGVRRTGIAGDREHAARGLACVAAPIMVDGRATAAISVAFAAKDGTGEVFVGPLRETAADLARAVAMTTLSLS